MLQKKHPLKNLLLEKQTDPEITIPTYIQLDNFKNNKTNKVMPSTFNFAELFEILESHSTEPIDDDEPYIINKQIKVDEDDLPEGPPVKSEQYRFAFSTKRLLTIASTYTRTIQADSTEW